MKNNKDLKAVEFAGKSGSVRANGNDISVSLNDAGVVRLAGYLKYDCHPRQQHFTASDAELAHILFGDVADCPLRASHPEHMARLFGEHPEQKAGQSILAYHEWIRLLENKVCRIWLPGAV